MFPEASCPWPYRSWSATNKEAVIFITHLEMFGIRTQRDSFLERSVDGECVGLRLRWLRMRLFELGNGCATVFARRRPNESNRSAKIRKTF
jgi:hypothetical protein